MKQPSVQLRQDRYYHLRYDAISLVAFLAVIVATRVWQWPGAVEWPFDRLWYWLALPLGFYLHVLASVFVHNATHGAFPRRINRLVGELAGLVIVTRYAAWEIIHRRHHKYADDPKKDPHPCQPSFLRYALTAMTVSLERQTHAQVLAWHGDTPKNRQIERLRTVLTNLTDTVALVSWAHVLGLPLFLSLFLPIQIAGWTLVTHFNWATHGGPEGPPYAPKNLDHGLYRLGNHLWFGLYMHANHHRRAHLFDPRHLPADATPDPC